MTALSTIETVTKYTRLQPHKLAEQARDEALRRLAPCTRSEAATLTAELLSCYPDITLARRNPDEERQFQAYSVKLFEVFEQFSFHIGKALVHAGTGLPATLPYRPKPSDVFAAGLKARERLENIVGMAGKHIAEAQRRAKEDAEPEVTPEQRSRIVAGLKVLSASLKAMPEPIHPRASRSTRQYGPASPAPSVDMAALLASHDAGIAEKAN